MNHRVKQQNNSHQKSHTFKVSSLTQECLNNLRKGTGTPKTHLLGFMSEYIQDEQQIKVQQVDELCCYDRMKKLLIKNEDNKQQRKQQQATLFKAMQIQAKMNQLERDLQNKLVLKNRSSASKLLQYRKKNDPKCKTQHNFSFKPNMIEDLKQKGYDKFFEFQKIKKQTNTNKIKAIIGQQVQSKLKKVINQKDTSNRKLVDQNKLLQRKLLQKNLELQTLRQEANHYKQYNKQIEEKLYGSNNELQNTHLIASYQKWISEFKQQFGQMSIKELKHDIQNMRVKCLEKFDLVQNRNQVKLSEVMKTNEGKIAKMKKEVEKLQIRENQLLEVNKNLKLNKQISQLQFNQLRRAKQQLMSLRKLILSLYNQWYEKRTENQKTLMKKFDKLKQNYAYEEMLQYAVFYQSKLSTNDKLNDYILKILRGIQKIRRIIFPMQSNQKLDPFLVLDKIQAWVVNKVRQKGLNNQKALKNHKITVEKLQKQREIEFLGDD